MRIPVQKGFLLELRCVPFQSQYLALMAPLYLDEAPELCFPETEAFLPYAFSVRTPSD